MLKIAAEKCKLKVKDHIKDPMFVLESVCENNTLQNNINMRSQ